MRIYCGLGKFSAGDKNVDLFLSFKKLRYMQTPIIRDKIYDIRGQKVMLDFDLAALYGVKREFLTRQLNGTSVDFLKILCFS